MIVKVGDDKKGKKDTSKKESKGVVKMSSSRPSKNKIRKVLRKLLNMDIIDLIDMALERYAPYRKVSADYVDRERSFGSVSLYTLLSHFVDVLDELEAGDSFRVARDLLKEAREDKALLWVLENIKVFYEFDGMYVTWDLYSNDAVLIKEMKNRGLMEDYGYGVTSVEKTVTTESDSVWSKFKVGGEAVRFLSPAELEQIIGS